MDQSLSITPPQELRDKWLDEAPNTSVYDYLIDSAAQWGSDQELTECLRYASDNGLSATRMRETRRPKPPSLKEQALMALEDGDTGPGASLTSAEVCIIRRALEQLHD